MHCGEPKVHVVGSAPLTPKTTLPGVLTCTFLVTEPAPAAITKPLPAAPPEVPSQATVGAPLVDKLPLTPPVYSVLHVASAQARMVSVCIAQVRPLPEA